MKNIAKGYRLPCLFIRFNLDEYKTPDIQETPKNKRLSKLKSLVNLYMNTERLGCDIGVIYLYYDGFSEGNTNQINNIQ